MTKTSFVPPQIQSYYDDWHFSPGREARGFVFLSGFTGVGLDGVLPAEPERQFVQAFETIALVLAEAELDFRHIVEMTSYHVALRRHLDVFRSVKDRYVAAPYPAWTAIGVAELAVEGALVEVKVTASRKAVS